jgi:hypothetical protein
MGLKFRRGTTAQQSGSLAFGEPYVNTTLGTLVIGGATGDIVLSSTGTGSTGTFGAISGSGLDITGNANIGGNLVLGGNITIGDNTADSVNVVASLSSSLIPQTDNIFDLGSLTKAWRDLYISTGSIKVVSNGEVVSTLSTNADGSQNFPNGLSVTGSLRVSGSTYIQKGLVIGGTGSSNPVNYPNALTINGNTAGTYGGGIFLSKGNVSQWGIVSDNTDDLIISNNNSFSTRKVKIYDSADKIEFTYSGSEADFGAGFHNIRFDANGIIPAQTNQYDLGSVTNIWRDLYISTGSIKMVSNGVVVSTLSNVGSGFQLDQGIIAKGDSSFGTSSAAVTSVTGSLNVTGSVMVIGEVSASTINGLGNVTLYSTSVNSRLAAAESFSSSLDSTFATDASVTIVSASAFGAFTSASSYSASAATDLSASNAARVALSASVAASGFAVSSSVASATATSITSLSSSVKAVTDTFATSASVASATATSISTLSGSVKTVTDALSGRVTTLEGTDISITLTGDVTGTGTITNLANVSFATTIAANSVALGTDTTGDYVGTITGGTGVTSTGATTGEGIAHTISIGQAVATSSDVRFNSLGVGMAASTTAGRIDASGDIVAFSTSDKNFKENITPIENPIQKIRMISGNTYDWKADMKEFHGFEGNDVGVIAQEIEAVLPQLVTTRETGYKAVKYDKLVALLIEGIKAQQNQIDSLTIEIENLKKNNSL